MLNDSGKDPQDNKFYDLGKLKDIGCFNILTILGTGKIKIKIRSVAIYRTTTVPTTTSIAHRIKKTPYANFRVLILRYGSIWAI